MRSIKKHLFIIMIAAFADAEAQNVNWASLNENKHVLNVNLGLEHGLIYGVGYGYRIRCKQFPILANIDLSVPSGKNVLEDFKTRIGGQVRIIDYKGFQFSGKIHGVFRRYENSLLRLMNFGSDFAGVAGYYRQNFFAAGEFGFDKAIVTHFKHSDAYRAQYAAVINGWYQPPTGGNYYYGIQGGASFKKHDITVRAGKIISQDFRTKPLLPFYAQLGYNIRF